MTKAFISYHHDRDQAYKEHLVDLSKRFGAFEDGSVNTGDIIDDGRSSESIRRLIRDRYLRDAEVTVLLCGQETKHRKHVDWEIKSSMITGAKNSKSGILVIDLPDSENRMWTAALPDEKSVIYGDYEGGWTSIENKSGYEQKYPDMPARIIDNLLCPKVKMSVVPWSRVQDNPNNLKWLIDATAGVALTNEYDMSLPMRRRNHNRSVI